MERRPLPGAIPAPPLPGPDTELYIIHCSQERAEDCVAATPAVSAVVVQNVQTGRQWAFAALHAAERRGISLEEWPDRWAELERELLERFLAFAANRPGATWLHWAMRVPTFGFDLLAHRARRHGLDPGDEFPGHEFDLANHLKRTLGRDFAPDPRLWHAIHRNGLEARGLLDGEQAKAAWNSGQYAALLRSLCLKVHAIGGLYELVLAGEFRTGGIESRSSDVSLPPIGGVLRRAAEPERVAPTPAELVEAMRRSGRRGKPTLVALVDLMQSRESASADLVAERVHGDRDATPGRIRSNLARANRELEALGADFRFRFAAGHVIKEHFGAAQGRDSAEISPRSHRSVSVAYPAALTRVAARAQGWRKFGGNLAEKSPIRTRRVARCPDDSPG